MTEIASFFADGDFRSNFRGRRLPIAARLAGYSALIEQFDLPVPLHHEMASISEKSVRRTENGWAVYPNTLRPASTTVDHLIFALKYEGVQLLTLKFLFEAMDRTEIERAARARPTSGYLRRICFFYEWLRLDMLDVPDTSAGSYIDALDPEQNYVARPENSKRFRIRDNLPGTWRFCPLVSRTHAIDDLMAERLSEKAKSLVDSASPELIARAAAFMLLSDSKASFAIEGETPPKDRIARWGGVIAKAGAIDLGIDEFERLQKEVIGDDRFVTLGLRQEGGFIGHHDLYAQPVPEHVSARHEDLEALLAGVYIFERASRRIHYDPVLAAASVAFGFVYIHPFEDGNGRIHRFLMHHVLSAHGFTPKEIIFPISSAILDDIPRYKAVLERTSRPLLEWIEWRGTERGNVEVLNETADYYRYFDATAHAEFLFKCIERTIDKDLPEELYFLEHRDAFHRDVTTLVDMGERRLDLLLTFLRQNGGTFSKRARNNEFAKLTEGEAEQIEAIYAELFLSSPH